MPKYKDYDDYVIEKLKDPAYASAYINVAFEEYFNDDDSEAFAQSLSYLIQANGGVTKVAEKACLDRKNLYKIFNNEVKPKLETVYKILRAMNYTLVITPFSEDKAS